jgi:hypothetical protein
MTRYLVFKHEHPNPHHWEPLGEVDAASANAAIRAFINGDKMIKMDGGGEFTAVPARSWQPVVVKVERTVKIG